MGDPRSHPIYELSALSSADFVVFDDTSWYAVPRTYLGWADRRVLTDVLPSVLDQEELVAELVAVSPMTAQTAWMILLEGIDTST